MNRIVLIGNGFDLAHGLPTSYNQFLNSYWKEWYEQLYTCKDWQLSDGLFRFCIKHDNQSDKGANIGHLISQFVWTWIHNRTLEQIVSNETISVESFNDITELCDAFNDYHEKTNSPHRIEGETTSYLFGAIINQLQAKWVDIENEYYGQLKKACDDGPVDELEMLNADLNGVKDKLISYLQEIQANKITDDIKNENIKKLLFEPLNHRDISIVGQEKFMQFVERRLNDSLDETTIKSLFRKYGYSPDFLMADIKYYLNDIGYNLLANATDIFGSKSQKHSQAVINNNTNKQVPDYFLLPDDILLLNFNYTKTANRLSIQNGYMMYHRSGNAA